MAFSMHLKSSLMGNLGGQISRSEGPVFVYYPNGYKCQAHLAIEFYKRYYGLNRQSIFEFENLIGEYILLASRKITPPSHNIGLLNRARLLDAILNDDRHTLMTVIAPAGYGKTTLLSQLYAEIKQRDVNSIWVSLDKTDRDPRHFLSYFLLALKNAGYPLDEYEIVSDLIPGTTPEESVIESIASFLESDEILYLFIDDYHLASSEPLNILLNRLLALLPPNCRMILASRVRPTINLSNFRLQGKLLEIREQDLRFNFEEISQFVGSGLHTEILNKLHELTKGWAAVVQLIKIHQQQSTLNIEWLSRLSQQEEITEYLSENILNDADHTERAFLIETAFLDSFNESLADYVRGHNDSRYLINRLQRLKPLLSKENNSPTPYRYHLLLKNFLLQLLSEDPRRESELYHRAAEWQFTHGNILSAIEYVCRCGDYPAAIRYMEEEGIWHIFLRYGTAKVLLLMKLFPEIIINEYQSLLLCRVYLLLKEGKIVQGRALFDRSYHQAKILSSETEMMTTILEAYEDKVVTADQILEAQEKITNSIKHSERSPSVPYTTLFMHYFSVGNIPQASATAIKGVELTQTENESYGGVFFYYHRGLCELLSAKPRHARDSFLDGIKTTTREFGDIQSLIAVGKVFVATSFLLQGKTQQCKKVLLPALRIVSEQDGWLNVYTTGYSVAVKMCLIDNDINTAIQFIDAGDQVATQRNLVRLSATLRILETEIALTQRNDPHCIDALNKQLEALLGESWEDNPFFWQMRYWRDRLSIKLALRRQLWKQAEQQISKARVFTDENHIALYKIELDLMMLTAIFHQERPPAEWKPVLQEHLLAMTHHSLMSPILELGDLIQPALMQFTEEEQPRLNKEQCEFLLLCNQQKFYPGHTETSSTETVGPHEFSERELQVIRILGNGSPNKVIARELEMTENTVKFHLKNIFRKLDVKKRTSAAIKAKQLGLTQ